MTSREVSNVGITGVDSIRIGGMTRENLPIRELALTNEQWGEIQAKAKEQEIANLRSKYPPTSIVYLQSRIRECEGNIVRMRGFKGDQQKIIDEYSGHIGLCRYRDEQIDKLDAQADADKIKALKKQFPPYNVDAMHTQVGLCREAIARADEVIDKEHASIAEVKEAITLCKRRDQELAALGAKVA